MNYRTKSVFKNVGVLVGTASIIGGMIFLATTPYFFPVVLGSILVAAIVTVCYVAIKEC